MEVEIGTGCTIKVKSPLVYVIVLNWNRLSDTLECLGSVFELDYPDFRVIVVDNASSDDSVATIRERFPQVTLIENSSNLGFTGGNNIGMRYAMAHGADYIWLLNNDAVVERNTLREIVNTAEGSPDVGLVSPVIYHYEDPNRVQCFGGYVDWKKQVLMNTGSLEETELREKDGHSSMWLWGAALLIKRDLIAKIGYLDEGMFAYWEDADYSVRSLEAGYKNRIDKSAKVYHKLSKEENQKINHAPYYYYYVIRNAYFFWMKHSGSVRRLLYKQQFLGDVILSAMSFYKCRAYEHGEACLQAGLSGFRKTSGPWLKDIQVPHFIKMLTRGFSSHPHLWGNLIKGNVSFFCGKLLRRAGGSHNENK